MVDERRRPVRPSRIKRTLPADGQPLARLKVRNVPDQSGIALDPAAASNDSRFNHSLRQWIAEGQVGQDCLPRIDQSRRIHDLSARMNHLSRGLIYK